MGALTLLMIENTENSRIVMRLRVAGFDPTVVLRMDPSFIEPELQEGPSMSVYGIAAIEQWIGQQSTTSVKAVLNE